MNCGILITLIFILLQCGCNKTPDPKSLTDGELKLKAKELSQKFLIIDTHIDIPYRLEENWENISLRTEKGHFDYPRAKEGGLNAAFMAIYIPSNLEQTGGGKELADELIDMIEGIASNDSDKFKVAYSVNDVLNNFTNGIFSLPMGMENGTPIGGKISNLKHFYTRGIRYITLSHSKSNHICDSSYDDEVLWDGLSPFGKELIREMNKIGMMIDVSHVTDSTFYDVLEISETPVIASHSSCRYFTPSWERNMSDEMIKELGINGGIIMFNFGASFIDGEVQVSNNKHWGNLESILNTKGFTFSDKEADPIIDDYFSKVYVKETNVSQVADHIDHAVKLAGIDHIGFGSDFDGVRFLPIGLKDVRGYPNLIYELLKRGYFEEDIEKICGKNFLRVWKEVEEIAKRLSSVKD